MLALRRPGNLAESIGPAWLKAARIDITALGGVTVLNPAHGGCGRLPRRVTLMDQRGAGRGHDD